MDVAFYLPGSVPVYTFSLLIAFGAGAGLFSVVSNDAEKKRHARLNAGLGALVGGAIIGRAVYVAVHWGYFQTQLIEIPQIWLGGISGSGALAGGIISLLLIAVIKNENFAELSDALLPLLTALTVSAWLGCWINGSLYGPEVATWWGISARDEWGEYATRWPLQLLGALFTLSIAWGVDQARARGWLRTPGLAAAIEVGGIALTLLWAARLRVDPVPQWRGLGLDAWAAMASILISIAGTVIFLNANPSNQ